MSEQDILILKIYVLLSPLLVALVALAAVWVGHWMDRREQRRSPANWPRA
jgi:hypothetical protein